MCYRACGVALVDFAILLWVLLPDLILCVISAVIAKHKERRPIIWFIITFFTGPIGLLIIALKKHGTSGYVPEKELKDRWECNKCGAVNYSEVCAKCGFVKSSDKKEIWICPKCGENNKSSSKYCLGCGELKK